MRPARLRKAIRGLRAGLTASDLSIAPRSSCVHANSSQEAFIRIALLIKASDEGPSLALDEIRRLLHTLVHVVVQLVFDRECGRHVPAIYYDPIYALSVVR